MKKTLAVALASSAAFGIASVANADVFVNVGDFTIGNVEGDFVQTVTLGAGANITGLDFEGFLAAQGGGALAGDTLLTVEAASGAQYTFGGYDNEDPATAWVGFAVGQNNMQSFDNVMDEAAEGDWTFTFSYDWGGGSTAFHTWENVGITLHQAIPAPGALALLGLAGICGVSRRRRA